MGGLTASLAGVSLVAAMAISGCVDPRGNLEEFAEKVGDSSSGVELPDGMLAQATGRYVVGLELALATGVPLRLLAEVDYSGDLVNGGPILVTFFPLDSDGNKVASVLEPSSGDAQIPASSVVDATGRFDLAFANGEVPGPANPLSGTDIKLTIRDLNCVILTADGWCGGFIDGESSTGTPLTGTVAALRVGDNDIGAALPATDTIPVSCITLQAALSGP